MIVATLEGMLRGGGSTPCGYMSLRETFSRQPRKFPKLFLLFLMRMPSFFYHDSVNFNVHLIRSMYQFQLHARIINFRKLEIELNYVIYCKRISSVITLLGKLYVRAARSQKLNWLANFFTRGLMFKTSSAPRSGVSCSVKLL